MPPIRLKAFGIHAGSRANRPQPTFLRNRRPPEQGTTRPCPDRSFSDVGSFHNRAWSQLTLGLGSVEDRFSCHSIAVPSGLLGSRYEMGPICKSAKSPRTVDSECLSRRKSGPCHSCRKVVVPSRFSVHEANHGGSNVSHWSRSQNETRIPNPHTPGQACWRWEIGTAGQPSQDSHWRHDC